MLVLMELSSEKAALPTSVSSGLTSSAASTPSPSKLGSTCFLQVLAPGESRWRPMELCSTRTLHAECSGTSFRKMVESRSEWASPGGSGSQPYGIAVTGDGGVWYSESGVRPNTLVRFDAQTRRFAKTAIPSG